jgi:D-3-phosphoglycerate dehydrogenase / 2-oxoglutarate reductase
MKKQILITENIVGPGIDGLRDKYDCRWEKDLWQKPEEILGIADRFDAIIVRNQTKVNAALLKAATRCQVIGRAGVGVDNVDVQTASELGIVVAFTPEENAISVAEEVLGMMLCLAKRFVGADASVKAGKWDRMAFLGVELFGKNLGIIGMGKIGARVAMRARAFGMRIIAYDPYLTRHHIHVTESQAELVDLETLLRTSDFITIHLPLTAETRHLIDRESLSRMKPTAYLINTSRGPIVNEADLYEALNGKVIAGAALDVREEEPPKASPLNSLENILLAPHVAAFTVEAQDKVQESLSEDVDRILSGKPALRFANFARPKRSV